MITLFSMRCALLSCVLVWLSGWSAQAGMTSYTDRGKADFDTAIQLLNPYGTWSKIDGKWAYTPLDHEAPYTDGRWIYTEYGWYWQGRLPHSWVTEHYGYWKRGANRVWSWYPGPYWLPQIVEIRSTSTDIGWRSGEVDEDGNFVEEAADRYAKTDEWTFVTLAQFANPITPDIVEKPDKVKSLLEDSVESRHTYLTYREIDRPGPHPADFVALCRDGGMFAPLTLQDQLVAQRKQTVYAPNSPANTTMTGTNGPSLLGTDIDPSADKRHVKYWITMSLPTFWTKPPPEAKPEEIYLYRPDFYQDEDGIARRIALWLDPMRRTTAKQSLSEILEGNAATAKTGGNGPATPATPAIPVEPLAPAKPQSAFQSPFDESFDRSGMSRSSSESSKAPAPSPATNAPDGLIPPPMVTNAAPVNRG